VSARSSLRCSLHLFLKNYLTCCAVVIVGAGAAGLSAARSLSELTSEVEIIVLEGRNRTGGRIETATLSG
jgi:monoamine oxidase